MIQGDVFLLSESAILRAGLVQALTQDTLSLVGEQPSAEAAIAYMQSTGQHVDVIVFDADGPEKLDDLKEITDQYPGVCIVVLARDPNSISLECANGVRAKAVLPNTVSPEALNLALQLIILGEDLLLATGQYFDVPKPITTPVQGTTASIALSPRETQILKFIRTGAPNKIIARRLDVAEATVKVHVKSLLRKIDVENRTQAAVWAMHYIQDEDTEAA